MKIAVVKLAFFSLCLIAISLILAFQSVAKVNANPIAVWLFDEGKGDVAKDFTGKGSDGKLMNGPEWVGGKFGKALSFDGVDDYVSITCTSSWDLGSKNFAFVLWFYPRDERKSGLITSDTDYWAGIMINYQGTRNVDIWASSNGVNWSIIHSDPGGNGIGKISVPLNQWSHAAYVRSGTHWTSYVNGVKDADVTASGTVVDRTGEAKILGRWGNPADRCWLNGIIDEAAVFSEALSESDIKSIMNNGLAQVLAVSPSGKLAVSWGMIKAQ